MFDSKWQQQRSELTNTFDTSCISPVHNIPGHVLGSVQFNSIHYSSFIFYSPPFIIIHDLKTQFNNILNANFLIQEANICILQSISTSMKQGNHPKTRKFRWLEHFPFFNSFPDDGGFIIMCFTFANVVLLKATYSKMVFFSSSLFPMHDIIKHHWYRATCVYSTQPSMAFLK